MNRDKSLGIFMAVGILVVATVGTMVLSSFRKIPEKTYSLSLTQQEWGNRLQWLQNAAVMLRTSSAPGNQIAATQDSLIQFEQDIQRQIGTQIQFEQKAVEEKRKTDSIENAKKPKK